MAASSTRTKPKKKQSAARQWKRVTAEEIDLPSGNTALVKRPGMEAFLTEGLMPDRLMPIIQESIATGRGLAPAKVKAMTEDPEMLASMMDAMDRVVAKIVIEPKVAWHKRFTDPADPHSQAEVIPEEDRDVEQFIYTDEVFFDDKAFLFNYAVGGTRDLERFRQESGASLAALDDVAGVPDETE